jgi:hypothetical protein
MRGKRQIAVDRIALVRLGLSLALVCVISQAELRTGG